MFHFFYLFFLVTVYFTNGQSNMDRFQQRGDENRNKDNRENNENKENMENKNIQCERSRYYFERKFCITVELKLNVTYFDKKKEEIKRNGRRTGEEKDVYIEKSELGHGIISLELIVIQSNIFENHLNFTFRRERSFEKEFQKAYFTISLSNDNSSNPGYGIDILFQRTGAELSNDTLVVRDSEKESEEEGEEKKDSKNNNSKDKNPMDNNLIDNNPMDRNPNNINPIDMNSMIEKMKPRGGVKLQSDANQMNPIVFNYGIKTEIGTGLDLFMKPIFIRIAYGKLKGNTTKKLKAEEIYYYPWPIFFPTFNAYLNSRDLCNGVQCFGTKHMETDNFCLKSGQCMAILSVAFNKEGYLFELYGLIAAKFYYAFSLIDSSGGSRLNFKCQRKDDNSMIVDSTWSKSNMIKEETPFSGVDGIQTKTFPDGQVPKCQVQIRRQVTVNERSLDLNASNVYVAFTFGLVGGDEKIGMRIAHPNKKLLAKWQDFSEYDFQVTMMDLAASTGSGNPNESGASDGSSQTTVAPKAPLKSSGQNRHDGRKAMMATIIYVLFLLKYNFR